MTPQTDHTSSNIARAFAAALEPTIGQVYFAPEAHAAYEQLGFANSPGAFDGLAMPDGPAYFTSRGSLMGQVAPTSVAATFAVFNPRAVVPAVEFGWSVTDAATIRRARQMAGGAQLRRVLADVHPSQLEVAITALQRTLAVMRPEGRSLFAGALYYYEPTDDPWEHYFTLGDIVREYRGDSHTAAWISAQLDATEINLLSEQYMGLGARSYARTRAWTDEDFDGALERLVRRGWMAADGTMTAAGRDGREAIEHATDAQMQPVLMAFGEDLASFIATITPWGTEIRAAHGYPGGPADLWPNR